MSALLAGPPGPFLVLLWPLLLGLLPAIPALRPRARLLLPLAPLPALALALAGVSNGARGATEVPPLLLGVTLAATPAGWLLMAMTAAVWAVAGVHAARTLVPGPATAILAGFWCLTLAGNLGVFLAADVVTFYVAFAAVSLAAWFLVVHERTAAALRAGRVYIVMAVIGEAALLAGLLIGAQAAGSLAIAEVRAALAGAPLGAPALGLILVAFAIKAGLVPLHVWLPLAHPAAPVPGSAVLSGAIVKAGVIGVLLFLPGSGHAWAGAGLVGLGLLGAFAAALWGLTQANPKAVLAYSTVSQMGLVLALAGAGQGAVGYYAAHHGLAKAALFLLVGVAAAAAGALRALALALAGLAAASVAGLPLTGGALAKAAAKPGLAPWAELAVTASGATTTLLLAWFLVGLAREGAKPGERAGPLLAGAGLLVAAALVAPWLLWPDWTALPRAYPLTAGALADGAWPALAGLAVAALLLRRPLPGLPPGDLLALLPARAPAPPVRGAPAAGRGTPGMLRAGRRGLAAARAIDARLARWPVGGTLLVAVALALAGLLG